MAVDKEAISLSRVYSYYSEPVNGSQQAWKLFYLNDIIIAIAKLVQINSF